MLDRFKLILQFNENEHELDLVEHTNSSCTESTAAATGYLVFCVMV